MLCGSLPGYWPLSSCSAAPSCSYPRRKSPAWRRHELGRRLQPGALKAIGALELLAAAGLILPAALDIAPVLVPLAATGAVVLFVGAVIMRLRRHEVYVVLDLVYLAMAAFVAWGRFGPESFTG